MGGKLCSYLTFLDAEKSDSRETGARKNSRTQPHTSTPITLPAAYSCRGIPLVGGKGTSLFLSIKKKINLLIGMSVCVFQVAFKEPLESPYDCRLMGEEDPVSSAPTQHQAHRLVRNVYQVARLHLCSKINTKT